MHSEPGKWLNEFQKLILVELEKCLNELKLVLLTRSITSLMALPSESESSSNRNSKRTLQCSSYKKVCRVEHLELNLNFF